MVLCLLGGGANKVLMGCVNSMYGTCFDRFLFGKKMEERRHSRCLRIPFCSVNLIEMNQACLMVKQGKELPETLKSKLIVNCLLQNFASQTSK